MPSLDKVHSKFAFDFIQSSRLSSKSYTILPSFFFLSGSFVLIYLHYHKWNTTFTRWKARLYKDILFHWSFFYVSRVWFIFIKACKWLLGYAEWLVDESSVGGKAYWNKALSHFCIFSLVLSVSLIPYLILTIKKCNRREIPNFLMWVAEDPWVRSEIGTSGHYLERPPRTDVIYANQNSAFRSRRSSSVDTNISLPTLSNFRNCKSMMAVNGPKTAENNPAEQQDNY